MRRRLPFLLILAAFVAIRLYHAGLPLVDASDWRQTDTASEAWFFTRTGIDLLRPQIFYDGPGPNYVQLELPWLPATAALLARVLPFGSWLLHAVAVAYATAALAFLYAFVRRRYGEAAALWSAAVFTVQPLGIFFERAFQPEPAMLAGMTASLYAAELGNPWLTALALAFALTAKLPAAVVVPAVALLLLERERWWQAGFWLPLAAAVAVAAGYTLASGYAADPNHQFIRFILKDLVTDPHYHVGEPAGPNFWRQNLLRDALGWPLALPGLLGAWRLRRERWFWAWAFALVAWCLVVVAHIGFNYYLLPLLPALAVVTGVGLRMIPWRTLAAAAVVAVPLLAWHDLQVLYALNWTDYQAGVALRERLGPGPIILGTYNPPILFYSRHHGWRADPLTLAELNRWRAAGARYLVPIGALSDPQVRAYVDAHFRREAVGPVVVYDLELPAGVTPATRNGG